MPRIRNMTNHPILVRSARRVWRDLSQILAARWKAPTAQGLETRLYLIRHGLERKLGVVDRRDMLVITHLQRWQFRPWLLAGALADASRSASRRRRSGRSTGLTVLLRRISSEYWLGLRARHTRHAMTNVRLRCPMRGAAPGPPEAGLNAVAMKVSGETYESRR